MPTQLATNSADTNEDKLGPLPSASSRGVSVGKDIDGLLASMSLETCLSLPESSKKIINTKTETGSEKMLIATIELMVHIFKNFPERLSNLNCPELSKLDFNNKNIDNSELTAVMQNCIQKNFDLEQFGAGKPYDLYLAFKANTPRYNSEPLSPQWDAANKKYNIPTQFAMNYRDTVKEEGNILSFRLDEKIRSVVKRESASKPSYIWYKVGNWGPFENRIAENQNFFAKTNDAGVITHGAHTKVTEHPEKYPELISTQPLSYTLQEVLEGVKKGSYIIDNSLTNDERLCFRPVPGINNNPKETNTIFAIPMNNNAKKPMAENMYHTISSNEACLDALNKNEHFSWNEKWGPKETAMRFEFNLQANTTGSGSEFKEVNEIVIPITKNTSTKSVFNCVKHSFECYNPFIQSNVNGLAIHAGPDGEPIIKQNYKGHTQFYNNHGKNQVMHINQHWNMQMDLGGQLVLAQINLVNEHLVGNKSPITIEPATFSAFTKALEENPNPLKQEDFQSIVNVGNSLGASGAEARISLCNHITAAIKANDSSPYKREIVNNLLNSLKSDKVTENNGNSNPATDAIKNLQSAASEKREKVSVVESSKANDRAETVEPEQEEKNYSRMRPH